MDKKKMPVGFFDSGVGGLSVLREAIGLMPSENYIYFGDSKNAPYGVKSVSEVKELTINSVEFLLNKGCKAIVVACNTATSAAVEDIRERYNSIPIVGIEPALKPAVLMKRKGRIIIMATPMTLAEKKFNKLMNNYKNEANIEPLPCPGLVEMIEKGILEGEALEDYLKDRVKEFINEGIAAVVLGCTHYPFIKESIKKVVGSSVPIIDGSKGTANQLKRQLEEYKILNASLNKGKVEIFNSNNQEDTIKLSYNLLGL